MWEKLLENIYKRFKEPLDVYSAIYPLYYACSLIGLAPYSLKKIENGRSTFQFSIFSVIKSGILVIFFAAVVVYNIIFHKPPLKDSDNKDKMRYFQEIFTSLLSCCSVIFGCIFATKIVEVFKIVEEVDISFRSLAVWVPYKDIYMKIILHLSLIGVGILGVAIYIIVLPPFIDPTNDYDFIKNFISWVVNLPYFINVLMEFQYYHYLNILRIRYKLLNEYLEALVQEDTPCNGWMDEEITTITPGGSKKEKKVAVFTSGKVPKSIAAISDPVFIVDQVAALHIKLTDTAHMINYAFCVQQLLRITVAFVSIVTALFWIAVNFSQSTDENGSEFNITFTLWAFSNACEVMGIVWITSETCEEANTCPRILHKIRNNTTNTKLQDTIEIYSLQMYHNRLSFSVCGLFPLDYTLLYTIVAGVTTYLVILIQFNNADFIKKNDTVNGSTPTSTTT